MSRYALMLTITAALTTSAAALAGEIYKWTDENGNVQYMDRPAGVASEERISIASRRTDSAAVQASNEARHERMATREEARAKKAEEQQAAADEQAEQEKREEKCAQSRARLEDYLRSQRLYREDESGERVYLDDDQILEARNRVQKQIEENCN